MKLRIDRETDALYFRLDASEIVEHAGCRRRHSL
jgi:hypothetical protein